MNNSKTVDPAATSLFDLIGDICEDHRQHHENNVSDEDAYLQFLVAEEAQMRLIEVALLTGSY